MFLSTLEIHFSTSLSLLPTFYASGVSPLLVVSERVWKFEKVLELDYSTHLDESNVVFIKKKIDLRSFLGL